MSSARPARRAVQWRLMLSWRVTPSALAQRWDAGARRGLFDERAQVELGRVVRASLQKGQVANRDLAVGKRRVSFRAWLLARRSQICFVRVRSGISAGWLWLSM